MLAGHPEGYDARLRRRARPSSASATACGSLGYVDDAELEALWRLAACAAFPTLAEGFGLPVVEAMRRGVPVACSDLPVLREVGGDVPVLLRPARPGARAAAALVRRDGRRRPRRSAGPSAPPGFTWEAAARGTLEAYERALA